jgi:hypothetical protein
MEWVHHRNFDMGRVYERMGILLSPTNRGNRRRDGVAEILPHRLQGRPDIRPHDPDIFVRPFRAGQGKAKR